jgi:hypothetical protein
MISGAICEQKGVKFQLIGLSSDEYVHSSYTWLIALMIAELELA